MISFHESLQKHPRTLRIQRNIAWSLLIKTVSALTNLIIVPLCIDFVDSSQYGVWLTLNSIVMWIFVFDLGLGNGLRNRFADAVANGKTKAARIYVSTTYFTITAFVIFLGIVFMLIRKIIPWTTILNAPTSLQIQLDILVPLMIFSLLGQFLLRLIGTLLIADQSPALNDLMYMYVNVFTLIIIFLMKHYFQGSLLIMGVILSVVPTLVFMIANIYYFKNRFNRYLPSFAYFEISKAKVLLNLGVQFFFVQLWAILLFSIGMVLISQFCGPEEVTEYTIVSRYFSLTTILGGIVIGPYWSAFTDAYSRNDINWIRHSMKQLKYIVFGLSVGVTIMFIFSGCIFDLWIGNRIRIPKSLSILMAIQTLIMLWNMPYVSFINGIGKIRLQLIVGGILGLLGICLSIVFMKYYDYGASGFVLATCVATLPTAFLWRIQFDKIIFNKATGIWIK